MAENTAYGEEINTTPLSNNVGTWRGITARLNSEGKLVWAREFGFSNNEALYNVSCLDNNNYMIVGHEENSGGKASYIKVNEDEKIPTCENKTSLEIINERKT